MEKKARWIRNEMEKKSLILTILYGRLGSFFLYRHKKTQSSEERLGFFYITLHSLPPKTQCEVYSGRFSGLRIALLLAPSRADPSTSSGLRAVDLASFVPDYSGVAVPDSHGVPSWVLSHLNTHSY